MNVRRKPIEIEYHKEKIVDDFVTKTGKEYVSSVFEVITDLALKFRQSTGLPDNYSEVSRQGKINKKNWGLQYLFNLMPIFEEWLDSMPSSATIEYFYDPNVTKSVEGTEVNDTPRVFLSNSADCYGIRSRAKVLKKLLNEDISIDENWLSLACGGALPCLNTVKDSSVTPNLTLVDYDLNNLRLAKDRAKEMKISKSTRVVWRDLTQKNSFGDTSWIRQILVGMKLKQRPFLLKKRLETNYYDRVEATGFLEYLGVEKAARFIKNSFELVKPGGVFITSNIRDTHPERAYTEGVVQWPYITFRTCEDVIDIVKTAGIDVDKIDIYLPDDNVYAIYVMRKK
jgi:hypothetical protein